MSRSAAQNPRNGRTVNFYQFKAEIEAIARREGCVFGDVVRRAVSREIQRCKRSQRRLEQPRTARRRAARV